MWPHAVRSARDRLPFPMNVPDVGGTGITSYNSSHDVGWKPGQSLVVRVCALETVQDMAGGVAA